MPTLMGILRSLPRELIDKSFMFRFTGRDEKGNTLANRTPGTDLGEAICGPDIAAIDTPTSIFTASSRSCGGHHQEINPLAGLHRPGMRGLTLSPSAPPNPSLTHTHTHTTTHAYRNAPPPPPPSSLSLSIYLIAKTANASWLTTVPHCHGNSVGKQSEL